MSNRGPATAAPTAASGTEPERPRVSTPGTKAASAFLASSRSASSKAATAELGLSAGVVFGHEEDRPSRAATSASDSCSRAPAVDWSALAPAGAWSCTPSFTPGPDSPAEWPAKRASKILAGVASRPLSRRAPRRAPQSGVKTGEGTHPLASFPPQSRRALRPWRALPIPHRHLLGIEGLSRAGHPVAARPGGRGGRGQPPGREEENDPARPHADQPVLRALDADAILLRDSPASGSAPTS